VKSLRVFLAFIKIRISISVSITTLAGYIFCSGVFESAAFWAALGVFLMASCSSALNELQEMKYDANMDRTKTRPLPMKLYSPLQGASIIVVLFLLASFILYRFTTIDALLLSWFNLFWYNGIYTPMKRFTAFAVVPGSVVGAVPVLIGWAASGGEWYHLNPLVLSFFMFLWQVPHFWLLISKYAADYKNAGFPTMADHFDQEQLSRLVFVWISSTILASLLLVYFQMLSSIAGKSFAVVINLWFWWISYANLLGKEKKPRKVFILINVFMLLLMIIVIIDSLYR